MQPLRLPIGTVGAANVRALVPLETEPAQILENAVFGLARRPLAVGIFDAQDERAVLAVGEQPVEERRAGIADVQVPGRARCET